MISRKSLRAIFQEGDEFQVFSPGGEPETIEGNDGRRYFKVVAVTKTTDEACWLDDERKPWETIEQEFMAEQYQLHE